MADTQQKVAEAEQEIERLQRRIDAQAEEGVTDWPSMQRMDRLEMYVLEMRRRGIV